MVYIRQRNLSKLHEYKYAGVDKSLTSKYILKPFYTNVAIKCFPMSMAYVVSPPFKRLEEIVLIRTLTRRPNLVRSPYVDSE
jgi:hypothetical protein